MNHEQFLYRKDSIGIEISALFPGCVIYIDKYSPCIHYWKLRAYCAHIGCRKYILTARRSDPRRFTIQVDSMTTHHLKPLSRQLRRYERDQAAEELEKQMSKKVLATKTNSADAAVIAAGNYQQVMSVDVYQKVRSEALQKQDRSSDDIDDVEKMRSVNPKENFISKTLSRNRFAVYIHSKRQHDVLHKLHQIRSLYGIQIVGRTDASGGIARDLPCGSPLYYALTVNPRIRDDKYSTPLPLSEQFNVSHTSADIAACYFDFILSHSSSYEDHPLLFDWMVTDFSYENFHAILKAFNSISLKRYLNLAKNWIDHKLKNGEFPEDFLLLVQIRMCYVHLMHTFALMTKRLYGKNKNKQLPQSRIILEILATMIKATDYLVIKECWTQLTILLKNEYINDCVENAIVEINKMKVEIRDEDCDGEKLVQAVDIEVLPEYDGTLYESNLFYLELRQIADEVTPFYYDDDEKQKNVYYNPEFLEKFLTRFVPLIPCWTNVLKYKSSSMSRLQLVFKTICTTSRLKDILESTKETCAWK